MPATCERRHGTDIWTIRSADGEAVADIVPSLGGLVASWRVQRGVRELLFRHGHFWDAAATRTRGGMPFLFPICGRLNLAGCRGAYGLDGRTYELGLHGFAEWKAWRVEGSTPDSVTIALEDDDATRAVYPFAFLVRLTYRLDGGALEAAMSVTNRGSKAMPYYAGFHPYLATDGLGRVAAPATRRMMYNASFDDVVGEERRDWVDIATDQAGFSKGLYDLGDRWRARVQVGEGREIGMSVRSDPGGLFRLLQLYTMPGEPFVCAEPWMGHANMLNKGGARLLGPGLTDHATLRMEFSPQA